MAEVDQLFSTSNFPLRTQSVARISLSPIIFIFFPLRRQTLTLQINNPAGVYTLSTGQQSFKIKLCQTPITSAPDGTRSHRWDADRHWALAIMAFHLGALGGERWKTNRRRIERAERSSPGKGINERTLSHVELDLICSPQRVLLMPLCLLETRKNTVDLCDVESN